MTSPPIVSHAHHLSLDPTGLCIPQFDGEPFLRITVLPEPDHPDTPWPEVVIDGAIRARIAARHVAHHRECDDPLCVAAWICAHQRTQRSPDITYVLIADDQTPVVIPAPEYRDLLEQLAYMGHPEEAAARIDPGYRVSAMTADQIRRGGPITARPVQLSDLMPSGSPPRQVAS